MVLPELISWLVSDGRGTAGTNLFRYTMPDTPDVVTCLYEYGGLPNEPEMGGTTVRMEFPHVTVHTRGEIDDADGPRLELQRIVTSFAKIGDQDILGVRYNAVIALMPPAPISKDANHRYRYTCNFRIFKGYSSS